MMRSMFSAVSGLRAHQTRMDVIGNNIANVNTVGFKGSRVTFQEVFSQTLRGAGSPQDGRGGTNPQQVGLGINVASMDTFHIRGAVERTDYNTDLMVNGDGFFIVADDPNFLNRSYTRGGNFALDEAGNLVTADGYRVLGYMADENGVLKSNLEGLQISKAVTFDAQVTANVNFEGNLNSETDILADPAKTVGNDDTFVYRLNGAKYEINPLFEETVARETSFQVYDNLGGIHQIKQAYIKVPGAAGPPAVSQYAVETFYVNEDGSMIRAAATGNLVGTPGHTIQFDNNGKLVGGTNAVFTVGEGLTNGAGAFTFDVDFSKLTMFANTSTASATKIDGYKQGTLDDFTIASTGEIMGIFNNGQRRVLGQIALANFKNPAGLEKTASNMYRTTSNSGQAITGVPGSGGFGNLNPGALEMSNVDLSREFTNMITTQRGFQANSRIITTSDEMLQEVVNMKR
ncbi:flagellar hook protein FlgE [Alkaliphilus serpentinus]|uniref:Flagellar hook protein FlgE n=1 Tax=Alkaliphilus serpentinus TaxID=1482731 RepID=A0A833HPW5_9FIRM|nr:flagellar hook protein FlgE [Alkaliphilus serpentinus]KAB3531380.1 flagellar hook protein FlgE [Alkaliphilus serpentinus]